MFLSEQSTGHLLLRPSQWKWERPDERRGCCRRSSIQTIPGRLCAIHPRKCELSLWSYSSVEPWPLASKSDRISNSRCLKSEESYMLNYFSVSFQFIYYIDLWKYLTLHLVSRQTTFGRCFRLRRCERLQLHRSSSSLKPIIWPLKTRFASTSPLLQLPGLILDWFWISKCCKVNSTVGDFCPAFAQVQFTKSLFMRIVSSTFLFPA